VLPHIRVNAPGHLPICDDDQNMILASTLLNDVNGCIYNGGKGSWSSKPDVWDNCSIPHERLFKTFARPVIREETEYMFVMSGRVTKTKAGYQVVFVEGRQGLPHNTDGLLVRVQFVSNCMQASATERYLSCPLVAFGEIDTHNKVRGFQPRLPKSSLDLLKGIIIIVDMRIFLGVPSRKGRFRLRLA
jgi:hypothetical protein